ncbi:Translation initiation factor 3 subunit b [Dispira simplex]|nr:Translation initiation factor 3 subunit b [Dispira simplex]
MPALDPRNLPERVEDLDFSDIEEKYQFTFNESFDNMIVVDHLPIVDSSKEEKLLKIVKKIFAPAGPIKDENVFMPKQEDASTGVSKSQGYMFIEFDTVEQAATAIRQLNGFKMDKTHILSVHKFTDVERYATMDDEYREPVMAPYEEREHLRSWLLDPKARDQFATMRGDEVSIYWNNKNGKPDLVVNRNKWTEKYLQWSPKGTFLTTFHRPGLVLWGGDSWGKIVRFVHPGVKFADYSPGEKYVVTFSPEPIDPEAVSMTSPQDNPFGPEDEGNHVAIWEIHTGSLLRTFPVPQLADVKPEDPLPALKDIWPHFKWSSDDRYFARVVPGKMLSIYEAPSMGLLDRKSIKVDGIVDFSWSPTSGKPGKPAATGQGSKNVDHVLAYWTPEMGNQPARVTLLNLPNKEIIRTKNLFNINECQLYWHPNGDYLAVKVERFSKSKKSTFSNVELFYLRDKSVPVETIELKDNILTFAWEPKGNKPRFVTISTVDPTLVQYNNSGMIMNTLRCNTISIYEPEKVTGVKAKVMQSTLGNFQCVFQLEKKASNTVQWSPQGRYLVLAVLRSTSVWDIEFWDTDYPTDTKSGSTTSVPQLLASPEHYGATEIEWDPTGRYVASYASAWRHSMENGFCVWDTRGSLLGKHTQEKFKQFLWRPRPPTLLTSAQRKQVAKNLGQYSKEFEEEDLLSENAASSAIIMKHRRQLDEWKAWRSRVEKEYSEERQVLGKPTTAEVSAGDEETIEEWVEELVEETEEIVE